jgi:signal transduction histidine kinase
MAPLLYSFCRHVVEQQLPLVVEDARVHDLVKDNPAIQDLGVVAYAGIPLITSESVALGSFCAIDHEPRKWNEADLLLLRGLAEATVTELELRHATRELIDTQQGLIAAREEAERVSQAKTEFMSRVSHELRTPLNAILGFAQLLEIDQLQPSQRESVDHIQRAGKHLLRLVDEMLEIDRIEADREKPDLEPVDLKAATDTVLELIRPLAAKRGITVKRPDSKEGGTRALADRHRLEQVLLNLVSNALKYNREGGDIAVSLGTEPEGARTITVVDTGPGIPAEEIGRLFEPFERLELDEPVEGSGLGLPIAKALTEFMGGTLEVTSRVGEGSAFKVSLQAAPAGG